MCVFVHAYAYVLCWKKGMLTLLDITLVMHTVVEGCSDSTTYLVDFAVLFTAYGLAQLW